MKLSFGNSILHELVHRLKWGKMPIKNRSNRPAVQTSDIFEKNTWRMHLESGSILALRK